MGKNLVFQAWFAVFAACGLGTSAHAQSPLGSFFLELRAPTIVTPSSGNAQLELLCGYTARPGGVAYILGGEMDVYATEPLFSDMQPIVRAWPPPYYRAPSPGILNPEGDAVNDIVAGQRDSFGLPVDDTNPLLLWTATWSTNDFTPRVIELSAYPGEHFNWGNPGGGTYEEFPDPGYATIIVRTDCLADLDGNAELDVFDYFAFQNFFMDASPVADLDADGELTIFDFLMFQNAFDAGC